MYVTYEAPDSARGCSLEGAPPNRNIHQTAGGIEYALKEIPGITRLMCSVFAAHGITSIEDLADCATDDLTGLSERRHTNIIRHRGILDGFAVSRRDCETMILNARIKAGWIGSSTGR